MTDSPDFGSNSFGETLDASSSLIDSKRSAIARNGSFNVDTPFTTAFVTGDRACASPPASCASPPTATASTTKRRRLVRLLRRGALLQRLRRHRLVAREEHHLARHRARGDQPHRPHRAAHRLLYRASRDLRRRVARQRVRRQHHLQRTTRTRSCCAATSPIVIACASAPASTRRATCCASA